MTTNHILSLMIYCNYDHLQYKFSMTYRDNITEHNNYYHLGYFLKFLVHEFGQSVYDNSIHYLQRRPQYYHGISEQLVFPVAVGAGNQGVLIYGPLSTSSSFEVAVNFTNENNGLVIDFCGESRFTKGIKCFDVSWLSDFSNEHEYLFIQNPGHLNINNIVDVKCNYNFDIIIESLQVIESITTSTTNGSVTPSKDIKLIIRKIVYDQLSTRILIYQRFFSLHNYARKLINMYCTNKQLFHPIQPMNLNKLLNKISQFQSSVIDVVTDTHDVGKDIHVFLFELIVHSSYRLI
eukprot:477447_1